ncbi:MAG: hypothetical protein AAGJ35_12675 [Myxococcota bacterium]
MKDEKKVSFWVLDRVALGLPVSEEEQHQIASDPESQAYLRRLRLAEQQPLPMWLKRRDVPQYSLEETTPKQPVSWWRRNLSILGIRFGANGSFGVRLVGAVGIFACMLWGVHLLWSVEDNHTVQSSRTNPYIGIKGGPSVHLYIRRQRRVQVWTPQQYVMPGDALRLKVVPAGMSYVYVLARSGEDLVLLYQQRLESQTPQLLPKAWAVDDAAEREQITVIFTSVAMSKPKLIERLRSGKRSDEVFWSQTFSLPKKNHHFGVEHHARDQQ